jgi:hypothetical protein
MTSSIIFLLNLICIYRENIIFFIFITQFSPFFFVEILICCRFKNLLLDIYLGFKFQEDLSDANNIQGREWRGNLLRLSSHHIVSAEPFSCTLGIDLIIHRYCYIFSHSSQEFPSYVCHTAHCRHMLHATALLPMWSSCTGHLLGHTR